MTAPGPTDTSTIRQFALESAAAENQIRVLEQLIKGLVLQHADKNGKVRIPMQTMNRIDKISDIEFNEVGKPSKRTGRMSVVWTIKLEK